MAYNTNQDRLASRTVTNLDQSLGKHGLTPLRGTTAVAGLNGVAIQCVTTCDFAVLKIGGVDFTANTLSQDPVISGGTVSIPAGTTIYGNVTDVQFNDQTSIAIVYNA
jgi:hypothetical protein